jgi:hypothetical protein
MSDTELLLKPKGRSKKLGIKSKELAWSSARQRFARSVRSHGRGADCG